MAGNTLGRRGWHLYVDDLGVKYCFLTDRDLGAATAAPLDDTFPRLPRHIRPRGVHAQATIGGKVVRKFLVCSTPESTVYAEATSQPVTVDTLVFATTGRRGEVVSFPSNGV